MGRPTAVRRTHEQVGDERGDGANDQVAKGDGDGDDDQRGEEHLHRSGHPLLNPVLEGRTEPDHEKDGDNGAGVTRGRHDERQAQERGVPREGASKAELHGTDNLARGQGNHGGIDQGKGDGHAVELAHLELLGRSKAKHHGQEVEHAVSDGVEQRVGAVVGKARDQEGSERQQALHDTGSGEGAEHGAKMPEMRSMITSVTPLGAASSSSASTAPPSLKPPALRTAS